MNNLKSTQVFFFTKQDFKNWCECGKIAWYKKDPSTNWLILDKLHAEKILSFGHKYFPEPIPKSISISPNEAALSLEQQQNEIINKVPEVPADQGKIIGQVARDWILENYDGVYDLSNNKFEQALTKTNALQNNRDCKVILEAAFVYQNFRMRCDILLRDTNEPDAWHILEVKAQTFNKRLLFLKELDNSKALNIIRDVSYQYVVLQKIGWNILGVEVFMINTDYYATVYEDLIDYQKLFCRIQNWQQGTDKQPFLSITDFCINDAEATWIQMLNMVKTWPQSSVDLGTWLTKNSHYNLIDDDKKIKNNYCEHIYPYLSGGADSVMTLYRNMGKSIYLWRELHISKLSSLSPNYTFKYNGRKKNFSAQQKRQISFHNHQSPIIHQHHFSEILTLFNQYQFPIYMLDFETVGLALPLLPYTKPYEQVPFQFSIHTILKKDFNINTKAGIAHSFYLANGDKGVDYRIEFIHALVKGLIKYGSGVYVAYNKSFEQGVIKRLIKFIARDECDLTAKQKQQFSLILKKICDQMLDLLDFFKKFQIYLTSFQGRSSIKYVLPAFVPTLSYNELVIPNGTFAQSIYYWRQAGAINNILWKQVFRPALITYCNQDTWAMVLLFNSIKKLITFTKYE